jgi:glutaredoxin
VHDLAVGANGQCVLCNRTAPPRDRLTAVALIAGVGVLLVALGVGVWLEWNRRAKIALENPDETETPAEQARTPAAAQDLSRRPPRERRAEPREPREPPPDVAPRGDVPVRMFTAAWCGACKSARAWLKRNRIPFTELDVEADPKARQDQLALNPRGSLPTLDIGGRVVVGFSPDAIQRALREASRTR